MHSENDPGSTPADTAAEPSHSGQTPSFEAALSQLGDTVSRLEGGGLGLSEAIAAYEQGVALLRQLHNELSNAEQRVRVLESVDQSGCPTTGSMVSAIGHSETRDATVHNGQETMGKRTSSRGGASAARTSPSRSGSAGKSTGPKSLPGMDDSSDCV